MAPADCLAGGLDHDAAVACCRTLYAKAGSGFGGDYASGVDVGNLQYGEVTYAGMEPLYSALQLKSGDVFYDLGCGVGKLVLYVALRGQAKRSIGLEIGERRQAVAGGVCQLLSTELSNQRAGKASSLSQIEHCAEFNVLLGDISRQRYSDATVVVLTNLCMDQGVQNRTIECLMRCPSTRRIVSITPLPTHVRLKLTRTVRVSCTWAKISTWHVYDVVEPMSRESILREIRIQRCPSMGYLEKRKPRTSSLPAIPRKADFQQEKVNPGLTEILEEGFDDSRKAPQVRRNPSRSRPRRVVALGSAGQTEATKAQTATSMVFSLSSSTLEALPSTEDISSTARVHKLSPLTRDAAAMPTLEETSLNTHDGTGFSEVEDLSPCDAQTQSCPVQNECQ
jgi:hypothetical protein